MPALPRLAALTLLAWLPVAAALAQPRAELLLDPRGEVGLNEHVQVTIKVDSPGQTRMAPPRFALENLQVVSGPTQSTSIQVINGVMSQSLSFIWLVQAQKLGRARVHSAVVEVDGKKLDLKPAELQVVENPPARPPRRPADPFDRFFKNDPFFQPDPNDGFFEQRRRRQQPARPPLLSLEAVIDEAKPWLGEQIVYTLYFTYADVNVRQVSPSRMPDFKGFWTEMLPQPDSSQPEVVEREGRRAIRIPLIQRALFPRQSGALTIDPAEAAMNLVSGDPIFGFSSQQPPATRLSNQIQLQARPLPEPAPPGFQGIVGQLSFEAKLEPRVLEVGQAATLELKLSGRGHLQGVAAPELPTIPGLQVFPPQQSGGESIKKTTVYGNRVWSYVLVPERAGKIALPALEIPYFDPTAGRYELASTRPLELEVTGSTQAIRATGDTVELHPIRPNALPAAAIVPPRPSLWPFAFLILPWIGLIWQLRRPAPKARGESRPPGGESTGAPPAGLTRSTGGASPAPAERPSRRELMAQLERMREEKKPRQAAQLFEETWRRFLEQQFGLPAGTPIAQWREHLLAQAVAPEKADLLGRITEDLHYLRYAPELSSTDELRADLLDRSERLLKALA